MSDFGDLCSLPDPRIVPVVVGTTRCYVIGVHRTHMIDCLSPGWSFRAVVDEKDKSIGFQVFNIDPHHA